MIDLEKTIRETDLRIGIGSKYSELEGVGTEYVVVDGQVIAKFLNGELDMGIIGNNERTFV